jgi:hypothetical protein
MIKRFVIIYLFFFVFNLNAQKKSKNSEVVGMPYKSFKQNKYQYLEFKNIIHVDNYYYAIAVTKCYGAGGSGVYQRSADFVVFKLDEKMNAVTKTVLSSEINGKDIETIDLKIVGKNLCAFYYFNNKKTLKQYLFAQLIDLTTLEVSGELLKISESPIHSSQKNTSSLFNIKISPDNKQFLVMCDKSKIVKTRKEKKTDKSKQNHKFTYWVYNQNIELLSYAKDVKFEKINTVFIDVAFDSKGNIGFFGLENDDNKEKKKKSDNDLKALGKTIVIKLIKSNGFDTILKIGKDISFTSAKLVYNKNTSNIAIVGLMFSPKGSNGIYTGQVNLDKGELILENDLRFSNELINDIDKLSRKFKVVYKKDNKVEQGNKKNSKKDNKITETTEGIDYIKNLTRIGECFYNDSNELIIVAQQFYTYVDIVFGTNSKGQTYSTTVTYSVYSNILSFKFNNKSELEGFGIVPHATNTSTLNEYKDYFALYDLGNLYIYTDYTIGKMNIDNKASELKAIKKKSVYIEPKTTNDILVLDNKKVFFANRSKRYLIFGMLSI